MASITHSPLLRAGNLGTHLQVGPNGLFGFLGSVHLDLPSGPYPTEEQAMQAFKRWFKQLPPDEGRRYAGDLRNDVWEFVLTDKRWGQCTDERGLEPAPPEELPRRRFEKGPPRDHSRVDAALAALNALHPD